MISNLLYVLSGQGSVLQHNVLIVHFMGNKNASIIFNYYISGKYVLVKHGGTHAYLITQEVGAGELWT